MRGSPAHSTKEIKKELASCDMETAPYQLTESIKQQCGALES